MNELTNNLITLALSFFGISVAFFVVGYIAESLNKKTIAKLAYIQCAIFLVFTIAIIII